MDKTARGETRTKVREEQSRRVLGVHANKGASKDFCIANEVGEGCLGGKASCRCRGQIECGMKGWCMRDQTPRAVSLPSSGTVKRKRTKAGKKPR